LGVFNASARHLLADLGRRISINTGEARETSYLFQRISDMLCYSFCYDFMADESISIVCKMSAHQFTTVQAARAVKQNYSSKTTAEMN